MEVCNTYKRYRACLPSRILAGHDEARQWPLGPLPSYNIGTEFLSGVMHFVPALGQIPIESFGVERTQDMPLRVSERAESSAVWSIEMHRPNHSGQSKGPHQSALCEGCKNGHCTQL